jgi:hypothetical protein
MAWTIKAEQPAHDLGHGWYAKLWNDGSLDLRNADRGQRISLTVEEANRLREIIKESESQ